MSKAKDRKPGYGKILDAWVPPEDAGEPVGCVATSFTFSPVLFEEECLGRFLQLESDATEDGPAYLVEREEKLSQLVCAAALVDQHHARGVRNLRWDLLPARLPHGGGILHAKVSLLLWRRRARLIVASANLTEDGYRRNHEVFGALDYFEGGEEPLPLLDAILAFLRQAVRYAEPATGTSAGVRRWSEFLDRVQQDTSGWGATEGPRFLARPRVFAVTTGPAQDNALEALRKGWPDNSPPAEAFVVSPFFDQPEAPNAPARELWTILRQRGDATVEFDVTAEEVAGEKALFVHAPQSLLDARPANRPQTDTIVKHLKLEEGRPLHAKSLWLQNDSAVLLMMGSSNFTSAGLGIGTTKNLEVNLAYAVGRQNKEVTDALCDAWLSVEDFPADVELRWQPRADEGEDSAATLLVLLPAAFADASFGCDEALGTFIEFTFAGTPPSGWTLYPEDEHQAFLTEPEWVAKGNPPQHRMPWPRERAPSGFSVRWPGAEGAAWWPVNVLTGAALPPPAELKNLPLEVLIDILTSAKPLHQALQRWLRGQKKRQTNETMPPLDPHKRVDTSAFLLQRTRRVSDGLRALRQRLERPVVSEQALYWRLRGPVGVMALAQAVAKEARSEQERCFLLTELCLELSRVCPQCPPGSLSAARVRAALREVTAGIRASISAEALAGVPSLAAYAKAAFEEAMR